MAERASLSHFSGRWLLRIGLVALALALWVVRDAVLLASSAVLLAIAVHGLADALAIAAATLIGAAVGIFWIFGARSPLNSQGPSTGCLTPGPG